MPDTTSNDVPDFHIPLQDVFKVSCNIAYAIPDQEAFVMPTLGNASILGSNPAKTRRKISSKDQNDPATRVSIYKFVFPMSKESDWKWFEPVGWVHVEELNKFSRMYAQCALTDAYMTKDVMVRFYDVEHGICSASTSIVMDNKDKYVHCMQGYWIRREHAIELLHWDSSYENKAKTIFLNRHASDTSYSRCNFDGQIWTSESLVKIRKSTKYKYVARKYLDGENFNSCSECGGHFEVDDLQFIEGPDIDLCETCRIQWEIKDTIKPHNYNKYPAIIAKPTLRFPTLKSTHGPITTSTERSRMEFPVRLFGVEVETEMHAHGMVKAGVLRHNVARNLMDVLGEDFILAKEDGSLVMNGKYSDNEIGSKYAGFELVTAPADLATHYSRWPMLSTAKYYSLLRSWDTPTCGFHVHVSRNGMSALQIARIVLFVNHPNNKLFIQKVAGRGSAKYCKYFNKEPKDAVGVHYKNDENRRQAVNLTNEKTVEFRIFRGTVNPKHILRNIEFCDAICDFCYPASRPLSDVNNKIKFLSFVENNKKRWPLLSAWMAIHGFISIDIPEPRFRDSMSIKMNDVPEAEILVDDAGNTATPTASASNFDDTF
jgi:hypothetical protein